MRIASVSDPPQLTTDDLDRIERESLALYEAYKRTRAMELVDEERRVVVR